MQVLFLQRDKIIPFVLHWYILVIVIAFLLVLDLELDNMVGNIV